MPTTKKYDIALSFAGEDRAYVEKVAECLKTFGIRVFYDKDQTANLWGKDIYDHLVDVYQKYAQYTVIFISKYYKEKVWTNLERRAAQSRALNESYEYVLPARFDDTELDGLLSTTGYIDLRKYKPYELSLLLCEKLGHDPLLSKLSTVPSPNSPSLQGIVTFNYSNFNGKYRIGDGLYEFETKWSKASNTSIHCYSDPPFIRGIALAPLGATLKEIVDAASLDYSSRIRTPEKGRFLVIQNTNGFYAALEIIDIKDDTRGDPADGLTFHYWILSDGSADFSKTACRVRSHRTIS